MLKKKLLIILTVIACLIAARGEANAAAWEPSKTWVFFACLVRWQDSKEFASFPEDVRKDGVFLDSLRAKGVPNEHIVYLKDEQATLSSVTSKFNEFLKKPGPNDWVIVYFEGHGYKDDDGTPYLATYDVNDDRHITGWKMDAVPASIERNFRGNRAVIVLDNCYSGAMDDAVKKTRRRVSYAIFASSLASQESTGNWTFTESLISSFKGSPIADANHDGVVTFAEMGKHSEDDMLFGEEQLATIDFTGDFDPQTVIAMAPKPAFQRLGEQVEAYSVDGWYKGFLVDSKGGKFKVHYYGYEDSDDEWVPPAKIRKPKLVQYPIGRRVLVQWEKKWYPATVLDVKGSVHLITYTGYGHEWDEWVSSDRIKIRK